MLVGMIGVYVTRLDTTWGKCECSDLVNIFVNISQCLMLELDEPQLGISRPTYFCRIWTFFQELLTIMTYKREATERQQIESVSKQSERSKFFFRLMWGERFLSKYISLIYIFPPWQEDSRKMYIWEQTPGWAWLY